MIAQDSPSQPEPSATLSAGPNELRSTLDVLIVIVNYRSAQLTIDCLHSLLPEVRANSQTRVVVVENASGRDQVEQIQAEIDRQGWSGWVELHPSEHNGGFAAGNNLAIHEAMTWNEPPRYFWLLNPDTLVRPGALRALKAYLDHNPQAGLVGSRLEHRDATVQNSAFRFPSIRGELEGGMRFGPMSRILRNQAVVRPVAGLSEQVDWVAGASLMIRREVFAQVGLLDPGYFMYFEEVDFCRRAFAAGWTCWYVPSSRVVHLVGQSSDVTSVAGATKRRPRYWFDARKRYFQIHHGRARTLVANLVHVMAFASFRLRSRLQGKPNVDPPHLLWDLIRYNFFRANR